MLPLIFFFVLLCSLSDVCCIVTCFFFLYVFLWCDSFPRQAQAALFEQTLATRVAELKANALAREAAVREQEQLDARHAERLQVRLVFHACCVFSVMTRAAVGTARKPSKASLTVYGGV